MKNLRNRINKFYKRYTPITATMHKSSMHNRDAIMFAYEDMWTTLEECGDMLTTAEYQWILALYGDLGDYIASLPEPVYKWYSATMGNIVTTFAEVLAQAWNSLIHYHTIDIRWHYCRKGY